MRIAPRVPLPRLLGLVAVALMVSPLYAATPQELASQVRDCIKQAAALKSIGQMRDRLTGVCSPLADQLVAALAPACGYTVSPSSVAVPADGGTAAIAVNANAGCPWSISTAETWLLNAAPASGTGPGTVTLTVAANTSTSVRSGTLMLAGTVVTVTQAGLPIPAPPSVVDFVDPGA